VVQVYDVGQDQGLHYYSMEYIENGTVEDLLRKQGRLDPELAVAVVLDAARGLVFAEKKGLVHRDIKPANLMINGEGVVKIADLGLAHDSGQKSGGDEPIFGTPHFISPEQALGRPVDARSDLYSLGATAYFLLAGQTPFDGENVQEIVRKQIEEDAPPLREKRNDLPPALCEIVAKLMRKDPADRFEGAQALVEALERLEAPASGGKKALWAAVAVLVLGGGGFAAWKFGPGAEKPPAPPPSPVAPSAADDAEKARLAADRAETERLRREADAKTALGEARVFDGEARASSRPDFEAVLAKYREVAEKHAGTEAAGIAAKAADEIAAKIADEAAKKAAESRAAESRRAEAAAAVAALRAEIEARIATGEYGSALTALADARRKAGDDAAFEAEIRRLVEVAETSAFAKAEALLAEARAAEAKGESESAAAKLSAEARRMVGEIASPATAKIDAAAKPLAEFASAMRKRAEEKRRADRAADAITVFEARRAAGELLQKSADVDAAAALLADGVARLRGDPSGSPLAADQALVAGAVRVREAWTKALQALPKDAKIKLPSPSDRKRTQEYALVSADAKGVTVKRGPAEVRFDLTTFTLADAYDSLFKDVVEKQEALREDAARLLLLAGRAERAGELAQELPDSPAKEALVAAAAREAAGWTLLAEIRDLAQKAQTDESAAGKLLGKVNRLLEEFADTRASLLNRRDPPARR
jgi:hypothetical protein